MSGDAVVIVVAVLLLGHAPEDPVTPLDQDRGESGGDQVLLVTVGDGTNFPTAAHLASYAGLAPTTKPSGTSIHGEHAPRGGNRQLKRAMFLSVLACMNRPQMTGTETTEEMRRHRLPGSQETAGAERKPYDCICTLDMKTAGFADPWQVREPVSGSWQSAGRTTAAAPSRPHRSDGKAGVGVVQAAVRPGERRAGRWSGSTQRASWIAARLL